MVWIFFWQLSRNIRFLTARNSNNKTKNMSKVKKTSRAVLVNTRRSLKRNCGIFWHLSRDIRFLTAGKKQNKEYSQENFLAGQNILKFVEKICSTTHSCCDRYIYNVFICLSLFSSSIHGYVYYVPIHEKITMLLTARWMGTYRMQILT